MCNHGSEIEGGALDVIPHGAADARNILARPPAKIPCTSQQGFRNCSTPRRLYLISNCGGDRSDLMVHAVSKDGKRGSLAEHGVGLQRQGTFAEVGAHLQVPLWHSW